MCLPPFQVAGLTKKYSLKGKESELNRFARRFVAFKITSSSCLPGDDSTQLLKLLSRRFCGCVLARQLASKVNPRLCRGNHKVGQFREQTPYAYLRKSLQEEKPPSSHSGLDPETRKLVDLGKTLALGFLYAGVTILVWFQPL